MLQVIINGQIDPIPKEALVIPNQADYFLNILVGLGYGSEQLPLGDFLAQYQGLHAGAFVVAEPIYWEASHNDAFILSFGDDFGLTEAEAKAFFEALKTFFKADVIEAIYFEKTRWLLEKSNKVIINAKPTKQMVHQSLMPAFNAMDSSMYWQQLMTELQMFLSNHPLNEKRLDKIPINGLWIYGEGSFLMPHDKKIISDDCQLVHQFEGSVAPLTDKTVLDEDSCLLITNPASLPHEMPNIPTTWRWNNAAFIIKKTNLWHRMWRKCRHADKT